MVKLIVDDDHTFRLALLVIILFEFPAAVYHRLRAHATREPLDRRQEGLFILMTLRPLGLAMWVGAIAFLTDPSSMAWSSVPMPAWLRWMGVGLCVMGGGLLVWTLGRLGKNLTDTVVTRREHTLLTHGPYRFVRHPFYDAAALFVPGISLLAANWFFFVVGVACVGLLVHRSRTEEANLLARFGAPDQEYLDRTGRFLPKISNRRLMTVDEVESSVMRSTAILASLSVVALVSTLSAQPQTDKTPLPKGQMPDLGRPTNVGDEPPFNVDASFPGAWTFEWDTAATT